MSTCNHSKEVLLALDCGAGGRQYRSYCLCCWRAGPALPHRSVRDRESVPVADPVLIGRARCAYWKQERAHV